MWEVLEKLKSWILSQNDVFTAAGLKALKEKDIVIGQIDLSRYENEVLVSLYPETSDDTDEYDFIDGQGLKQSVTITVLIRKDKYEKLVEKMCKIESLLCHQIREDVTLGGNFSGCGLGERKFYLDAGAIENQMTAVEIPLTLLYEDIL